MRKIIEEAGKFYVQETTTGPEVTLTLLEDQLAAIKGAKESALAAKAADFDGRIADVESQIGEIKGLQKPAEARKKPPKKKAADGKGEKTGRRKPRKTG